MLGDAFKRYPRYRATELKWLGGIPSHWELRRLRTLAQIVNGATPSTATPAYWNGDIAWLTPEDLGSVATPYIERGERSITRQGYEACGAIIAPAGSLVISTRAPIGHVAILQQPACVNQGCRLVVPMGDAIVKYLYYQLIHRRHDIASLGQGSTFTELSRGALARYRVTWPPLNEQISIVRFLDHETTRIDTLIERKQHLVHLLEEQRTALIRRSVTRGLAADMAMKDTGVAWLGDIPAHWGVRRLRTLAEIVNGATPSTATSSYWNGNIAWLTPEDLGKVAAPYIDGGARSITQQGYEACGTTIAPAGSIAISTRAPIGHLAILRQPACVNQGCRLVVPAGNAVVKYLYYQLTVARHDIASLGQGSTFTELSRETLATYRIAWPPPKEQAGIVRFLDRKTAKIDALVAKVQEVIERLNEYRLALIYAAVTGNIDVREEATQ